MENAPKFFCADKSVNCRAMAVAALSALVSALIYGYNYGADPNLAQILPFIHKLQNPALYPGDPYIQSLASFPSLYPYMVAALVKPAWLPLFHACGYALASAAFFWLAYRLALLLFKDEKTAAVSCLLMALSPLITVLSILGDDPILKTSFYQTMLAAPVSLGAIYLFLSGRPSWALGLAGGLYWINALPANYLAALLFAASLAAADKKKLLPGWALFAVLFGGWVFWRHGLPNAFGPASPEYERVLRAWYLGHAYPFSWTAEKWGRAATYLVLFGFFIREGVGRTAFTRQIAAFLWALLGMWLIGLAAAEFVHLPLLQTAQLFRSDTLFLAVGIFFAADYIVELLKSGEAEGACLVGLLVISLTELGAPYVAPFAVLLLLARKFYPRWAEAVAAGSALACVFYSFITPLLALKTGAAAALFAWLFLVRAGKAPRADAAKWALALALLQFLPAAYERMHVGLEYLPQRERQWRAVQRWAAENTPESAVFFTPMPQQGFRVFSLRSSVCEWLDGAGMYWAPGFEKTWLARQHDLYYLTGASGHGEKELQPHERAARFAALARKYGADFVVDEGQEPLPFSLLYSTGSFSVYRISPVQGL